MSALKQAHNSLTYPNLQSFFKKYCGNTRISLQMHLFAIRFGLVSVPRTGKEFQMSQIFLKIAGSPSLNWMR